ncbi:hypothetical protein C0995_001374 [Termitomyces sp. Mi166|nr:hypothetical protein C0995_001374 [Termitomyces sp. Mi166\
MPSARLPQELTDSIIDELLDDTATLLNCSLVCRAWTPTCQRYIFQFLTLGGSSNVIRFGNAGAHIRFCSDEQQYLQFNDFLEKTPHITPYICILDLRIQSYFKQLTFDSKDIAKALGLVLSKLTSLRRFRSNLGKWASFLPEFRIAISSVLLHQSITDIALGISEFASTSELALLLGRNSNLKHLSVSDSAIQDLSSIEAAGAFSRKAIYLDYLGVDTRGHIEKLFHPPFPVNLSKLRKLRLGLIDRCPDTQLLLRQCAASLQHLALYCGLNQYRHSPDTDISLELFSNLRSLHFSDLRQTKSFSPAQGIAQLLTSVNTPLPLEEVEILLAAWSMSRKDVICKADAFVWSPCRQIDAFLAHNDKGRLRRVRVWFVTLDMGYQPQEAGLELRKAFSFLSTMPSVQLELAIGAERTPF